MNEQARFDAEDAAKWRLMLQMMDADRIRVVMRGGVGADDSDAGMFADDAGEIVEHLVSAAHNEYPEGLPYEVRMLVNVLDGGDEG